MLNTPGSRPLLTRITQYLIGNSCMPRRLILAALVGALTVSAAAQTQPPVTTSIAARTANLDKRDGLIPIYIDWRQGKLLLELPRDSMRVLFFTSQATGLGSNPIGIDRGAGGQEQIARFDRDGDHVLVVFENWAYRSSAYDDRAHQRSVAEAFPPSTIAALPLVAEEGGHLLVDATELAMRDWNDVAGTLARSQQGTYAVSRDRSSITRAYTKAFPTTTEIDASLTFATAG